MTVVIDDTLDLDRIDVAAAREFEARLGAWIERLEADPNDLAAAAAVGAAIESLELAGLAPLARAVRGHLADVELRRRREEPSRCK